MTHEAFREHWLTDHVPLAKRLDGLRGYRTSLPVAPAASPYDGIAELYFDDVDAFKAVLGPDSDNPAINDVDSFEARSDRHLVTETVHYDALGDRSRSAKLVAVVARAEGCSHEAFLDGWLDGVNPEGVPSIRKFTSATPVAPAEADYGGIVELYVDDVETLRTTVGVDGPIRAADLAGPITRALPTNGGVVGWTTVHPVEELVQVALDD
nr:EthD family reductase [Halomarina oriensis]